jgi:peptide subunit release factor 1 (eRF1)
MTTAIPLLRDRVLVVALDRARARFFEVTARGCVELPGLSLPATRGGRFHSDRHGSPGWGERDYHGRLHEEERREVEGIVRALERLDGHPADGLLLAGPKAAVAALQRALPPALAERLIGTTRLNPTAITPALIARAARAAQGGQEPVTERTLVRAVDRGVGNGRATNGPRETLRALAKRQVRTLLTAPGATLQGFRCAGSKRLVLAAVECVEEGKPMRVHNLLDQAIADARAQDANIVEIHDPELAKQIDVMAALLRWSDEGSRPA